VAVKPSDRLRRKTVDAHLLGFSYLLYGLLLDLALPELLEQHQLGLLESQFLLQGFDDALPLLGRAPLQTAEQRGSVSGHASPMRRVQSPNAVSLTMSLSVSVFEKQWPFVRGLDGSLSDNKMTSSGDGGCRSLLMSLRGGGKQQQRQR